MWHMLCLQKLEYRQKSCAPAPDTALGKLKREIKYSTPMRLASRNGVLLSMRCSILPPRTAFLNADIAFATGANVGGFAPNYDPNIPAPPNVTKGTCPPDLLSRWITGASFLPWYSSCCPVFVHLFLCQSSVWLCYPCTILQRACKTSL